MNNTLYYRVLAMALFGMLLRGAYAQDSRPRAVEAGFCVAPTVCWAAPHTDNYQRAGTKVGGHYGVVADINLVRTKEFVYASTGLVFKHLRFGLDYTDKYMLEKKNETIDSARITSTYNTIFLTIPTAIKLKTDQFSNFAIFGVVGLEHGFRLSAKSKDIVTRPDNSEEPANKANQTDNIVLFKESLFATIGVEYTLFSHTKASFGIAYNYGLNSIFKRKYENAMTNKKVSANIHTIEFQFGFIF